MNETFHTFFLLIFFNLSLSPRCGIIFLNSSGVFINSWRVVRSLISKSIGKASNIRNKRQKHGYILRLEMLDFFKTYYPANSIEPKPDPFSTCFFIKRKLSKNKITYAADVFNIHGYFTREAGNGTLCTRCALGAVAHNATSSSTVSQVYSYVIQNRHINS